MRLRCRVRLLAMAAGVDPSIFFALRPLPIVDPTCFFLISLSLFLDLFFMRKPNQFLLPFSGSCRGYSPLMQATAAGARSRSSS